MKEPLNLLFKSIEDKTIVWLGHQNKYIILENTTASILEKRNKGIAIGSIASDLSKQLAIPETELIEFIKELEERFLNTSKEKEEEITNYSTLKTPIISGISKYYQVNDIVFKVDFSNEYELYLIHPKFAHLEIEEKNYDEHFVVFNKNHEVYLSVNNKVINSWTQERIHYFQGKFSMEFIQAIHHKTEAEWLGAFHASAVGNGEKTVLFLGDSGNGKSTSLALLQANGFTCVADDFVPMDVQNQEVHSFPAAISIKKSSLDTLLPIYPELATTAEHHFKSLNKIVRFLKPNNTDFKQHLPCKDLVFIKYEKDATMECHKISKLDAFQQLVPDSWLSPLKENAHVFLDWFETLNCYQIKYANNDEMIQTVRQIFNNDL